MSSKIYDVLIIGGGQAGLSVAYFLRRTDLSFRILDDQPNAGGSWRHAWETLRLFSPTEFSSIPGWQMPRGDDEYPHKDEFVAYLSSYERRYDLPVERPVRVISVQHNGELFEVITDKGKFLARTVVSTTGTAQNPTTPDYLGAELFQGVQMHSSEFRSTGGLEGKKVAIVGGGNSGAQILAEISKVADATWVTLEEPQFMPDDIDGRYLFDAATRSFQAKSAPKQAAKSEQKKNVSLSNVVMVESVKEARARGVLNSVRPFKNFTETGVTWDDGSTSTFDVIIWCTGFKANLQHLEALGVVKNNRVETNGTQSVEFPRLWLVGYGGWTGFASATIYGVQKSARTTSLEIRETLT